MTQECQCSKPCLNKIIEEVHPHGPWCHLISSNHCILFCRNSLPFSNTSLLHSWNRWSSISSSQCENKTMNLSSRVATFHSPNSVQSAATVLVLNLQPICVCSVILWCPSVIIFYDYECMCMTWQLIICGQHFVKNKSRGVFLVPGSELCFNDCRNMVFVCVLVL